MKDDKTSSIIQKSKKIIKWIYVSSSIFIWIPLLLLLIPQSLSPMLWPHARLTPAYIWAEPAGVLWAYIIDGMIVSVFGYRIIMWWINKIKKVNRTLLSIISFIMGMFLASIGWWIFRAYELSPIIAKKELAPFFMLEKTQKMYQTVVKELNYSKPQSIEKAKRCALITIEAFVDYYEQLEKKPYIPIQKYYYTEYIEAKQFLKKYKKNQNEIASPNGETADANSP